jgi:hypothetical protein
VRPHALGRSQLAWLDRFIVPGEIPLKTQALAGLLIPIIPTAWIWVTAPWQVGVVEAYAGLVWAGYSLANFALLLLGGWLADTFGFHVIFGASGARRLIGIALYVWLAVWPILGARGRRPATSPAAAT